MSKFVETSSGWQHVDLPGTVVTFPQRPPEWIAPFLVIIYRRGLDNGAASTRGDIREAFRLLGVKMDDEP
ncbi:MAG: hypothetical protein U1E40_10910 [Amaricoccus sp.]